MKSRHKFPLPANMIGEDGDYRCGWCDGRYCTDGCGSGAPNWVYVKGTGWRHIEDIDAETASAVECRACGGEMGRHMKQDCEGAEHSLFFMESDSAPRILNCSCSCGWRVNGPRPKVIRWATEHPAMTTDKEGPE